jgi:hypothetical protein
MQIQLYLKCSSEFVHPQKNHSNHNDQLRSYQEW